MRSKIIIFLSLMFLLTPSFCFAKEIKIDRTYYDVSDVLEMDGIVYDPNTDTVTITDFNGISIQSEYDLNVVVNGNNTLDNDRSMSSCIKGKNVVIEGQGTLNLKSNSNGIYANKLIINNSNINMLTKGSAFVINSENPLLEINNSNLEIDSYNLNALDNNININNSNLLINSKEKINIDNIILQNSLISFSNDNNSYHNDYLEDDIYVKIIKDEFNDVLDQNNEFDNTTFNQEDSNSDTDNDNNSLSSIETNDEINNNDISESLIINENELEIEKIELNEEEKIKIEDQNNLEQETIQHELEVNEIPKIDEGTVVYENFDDVAESTNVLDSKSNTFDVRSEVSSDNFKNTFKTNKTIFNSVNKIKRYLSLFISYVSGIIVFVFTRRRVHG